MPKNYWISGAIKKKNKGALRRSLGIRKGSKIPMSMLEAHDQGNGILARRIHLAKSLMRMRMRKRNG